MPLWGLTSAQLKLRPWGLDPKLLASAKTITDPVHGDVYVTELEKRIIDSPPMQRLRRVHQVGTTHWIYPGATHSRFSHALGALRASQDLLDFVIEQRTGPSPQPDLFGEWEEEGARKQDPSLYPFRLAEATVLARLGGLLHDLCHVAFGHTVEDDLGLLTPHDENLERFSELWAGICESDPEVAKALSGDLAAALFPLIMSKRDRVKDNPFVGADGVHAEAADRYPFVGDIVGNTICADLLDYLRRDHQYLGLPMALGHRFLNGFYVTPTATPEAHRHRMVVSVARKGRERADVISELFKYLRYRYEESERALYHHAKLEIDARVGVLLELVHTLEWLDAAVEEGLVALDVVGGAEWQAFVEVRGKVLAGAAEGVTECGARARSLLDQVRTAVAKPVTGRTASDTSRRGDLLKTLDEAGRALEAGLAAMGSVSNAGAGSDHALHQAQTALTEVVEKAHVAESLARQSDLVPSRPIAEAAVQAGAAVTALAKVAAVGARARGRLERLVLERGDWGLLEHLYYSNRGSSGEIALAIHEAAGNLLHRGLFDAAAYSHPGAAARAAEIAKDYAAPARRHALVLAAAQAASEAAGYELPWWKFALWIPDPHMRLKPAGVLVDDGRHIAPLQELDRRGRNRGKEIYDSHEALWYVMLLADGDVPERARRAAMDVVAPALGITWSDKPPVEQQEEAPPPVRDESALISAIAKVAGLEGEKLRRFEDAAAANTIAARSKAPEERPVTLLQLAARIASEQTAAAEDRLPLSPPEAG